MHGIAQAVIPGSSRHLKSKLGYKNNEWDSEGDLNDDFFMA
jgi:hypothetical protein